MRCATAPGLTVDAVRRAREVNRAWAQKHRACSRRQPWLLGAPPYGHYLPGGGFTLNVQPAPRWPVELRNTRALHGMVTALMGIEHDPHVPQFSLIPWPTPFGWSVWTQHADVAQRLAGHRHNARLYDQDVTVTCGPLARVRAPVVTHRGRRRLRIDAVTPVRLRADSERLTQPTAAHLAGALRDWIPPRLGVEIDQNDLALEVVESRTQAALVQTGGKFGPTRGWTGHLVVDTNAVGHWLLEVAARIGLGGRVALGFGRVRVSNAD